MGWDQGSQSRDLGSKDVGSGSIVLGGYQGSIVPTEIQINHKMTKFSLIGRKELPRFTNLNVFLR